MHKICLFLTWVAHPQVLQWGNSSVHLWVDPEPPPHLLQNNMKTTINLNITFIHSTMSKQWKSIFTQRNYSRKTRITVENPTFWIQSFCFKLLHNNFFWQVLNKVFAEISNDEQRIVCLPCEDIATNRQIIFNICSEIVDSEKWTFWIAILMHMYKHNTINAVAYSSHWAEALSSEALTKNTLTREPKFPVWRLLMEKFLQMRAVASSRRRWSALKEVPKILHESWRIQQSHLFITNWNGLQRNILINLKNS